VWSNNERLFPVWKGLKPENVNNLNSSFYCLNYNSLPFFPEAAGIGTFPLRQVAGVSQSLISPLLFIIQTSNGRNI
jgi:hypothetical protein